MMKGKWRPGRDVVWVLVGVTGYVPQPTGLNLVTLCFPVRVDWEPSVAVDGSQVADLLSWAHSLRSCHGFWLFSDRLIGGGEGWKSKHHIKTGSQVWGLGVQVSTGTWTPDRSGMGWSCLCLGYKQGVCFGVLSWNTLVHESLFLWDSTTWLWSSTVVRTGIWNMVKWFWLLNRCLKVEHVLT